MAESDQPSTSYAATERRPIASRDLKASQLVAAWLARKGVSPNAISVAGIAASALAGVAFWLTSRDPGDVATRLLWLVGAAGVQSRLLANMFDGMVAIASGKASRVGELYNEVPDRLSDAATFIGLGYAAHSSAPLGYLAALAAVFTAYTRAMGKTVGGPQDYCGPMAKPQRIFVVTVLAVYCALAPQAWQPIWAERNLGLPALALAIVFLGSLVTSARRLRHTAEFLKR